MACLSACFLFCNCQTRFWHRGACPASSSRQPAMRSSCVSTTDVVSTQTSVLHTERRQSECTYRFELQIATCLAWDRKVHRSRPERSRARPLPRPVHALLLATRQVSACMLASVRILARPCTPQGPGRASVPMRQQLCAVVTHKLSNSAPLLSREILMRC